VKHLFVASTGGHLSQLLRLSDAMDAANDSLWVTFRSPQSESMLRDRRVLYVPYVRPRDVIGVLRAARVINRVFVEEKFDRVVSTGAALALSALPLATLRGIPAQYIESVSRVNGPSLTGRVLAATRTADLYTQTPSWAHGRWKHHESVFGMYQSIQGPKPGSPRLLVTVGTIEPYEFTALLDAVKATGLADERTVWQIGSTRSVDLPGTTVRQFTPDEFKHHVRNADVVITHAGVGTLMELLDAGIHPVVVPRRKARNEHIDDHQCEIARVLSALGVATVAEVGDLTSQLIIGASGRSIRSVPG